MFGWFKRLFSSTSAKSEARRTQDKVMRSLDEELAKYPPPIWRRSPPARLYEPVRSSSWQAPPSASSDNAIATYAIIGAAMLSTSDSASASDFGSSSDFSGGGGDFGGGGSDSSW